jgi:hypothetical protein
VLRNFSTSQLSDRAIYGLRQGQAVQNPSTAGLCSSGGRFREFNVQANNSQASRGVSGILKMTKCKVRHSSKKNRSETALTGFFLLGNSSRIESFLLLFKILALGKPDRLPLAALQVTFSILIHFGASMR